MPDEISKMGDEEKRQLHEIPPTRGAFTFFKNFAREILAITFWIYVVVKLFIFDIDLFLVNIVIPQYAWVLDFKFFILISIITIAWAATKNKNLVLWFLYITFYPIVILFWRIPYILFKQKSWLLAFASINAAISFLSGIKYTFIMGTCFLVPMALIYSFSDAKVLWPSISAMFIVLIVTYIHRFISVFRPSAAFEVHKNIFSGVRKHGAKAFSIDDDIRALPVQSLTEKQLERWTTNLQSAVLFNRVCLFAARKLEEFQTSGINVVSSVVMVLLLTIFTVVAFAGIHYGLYKIDAGFFRMSVPGDLFIFFYYSFNNLVFNSIGEVVPISPVSQSAAMIESFCALFLVVIFTSVLLSVRSQRYGEELKGLIGQIEREGKWMEGFIRDEYKVKGVGEAIEQLERLKAGLIKLIYQLSKGIE